MPKKDQMIKIRTTIEEKEKLKSIANAHALKLSEYLRQVGLAQEIKSRTEIKTVLQLAKLNADQARLGNLLKLAIDFEKTKEIEELITTIHHTQKCIKDAVNRIG